MIFSNSLNRLACALLALSATTLWACDDDDSTSEDAAVISGDSGAAGEAGEGGAAGEAGEGGAAGEAGEGGAAGEAGEGGAAGEAGEGGAAGEAGEGGAAGEAGGEVPECVTEADCRVDGPCGVVTCEDGTCHYANTLKPDCCVLDTDCEQLPSICYEAYCKPDNTCGVREIAGCTEPCTSSEECSAIDLCHTVSCINGECASATIENCCISSDDCASNAVNTFCNAENRCAEPPQIKLLISEYVEPASGNGKAIEIYNAGSDEVDLSYCKLVQHNAGAEEATLNFVLSLAPSEQEAANNVTHKVAAGDVFVVCHGQGNFEDGVCDMKSTSQMMGFNGNDAVELVCLDRTLDVVGEIGNNANIIADMTLVRKCGIAEGTTSFNKDDWKQLEAGNVENLGSHRAVCPAVRTAEWCNFQSPMTAKVKKGSMLTAASRVLAGSADDADVVVNIGYKPTSVEEGQTAEWTWIGASKVAAPDGMAADKSQYEAQFAVYTTGDYVLAAKVTVDDGQSWMMCHGGAVNEATGECDGECEGLMNAAAFDESKGGKLSVVECLSSAECSNGASCANGVCAVLTCTEENFATICVAPGDCEQASGCNEGVCVYETTCQAGEYCEAGTCVAIPSSNVFISEYVEGSANNKAIEIYNAGTTAVPLERIALKLYANACPSNGECAVPNATEIVLEKEGKTELGAGEVFVICHQEAGDTLKSKCDQLSYNLTYNGKDGDAIELTIYGAAVDTFGTKGTTDGDIQDKTMRRDCAVTQGNMTFTTSEWHESRQDDFSTIGGRTCEGGTEIVYCNADNECIAADGCHQSTCSEAHVCVESEIADCQLCSAASECTASDACHTPKCYNGVCGEAPIANCCDTSNESLSCGEGKVCVTGSDTTVGLCKDKVTCTAENVDSQCHGADACQVAQCVIAEGETSGYCDYVDAGIENCCVSDAACSGDMACNTVSHTCVSAAASTPSKMFFSELYHGTLSHNNFVELYNADDQAVDMHNCKLVYGSGSEAALIGYEKNSTAAFPTYLDAGATFTICQRNSASKDPTPDTGVFAGCDAYTTAAFMTNSNAIKIVCDGETLDSVGGTDSAGVGFMQRLTNPMRGIDRQRICSVTEGNKGTNPANVAEWLTTVGTETTRELDTDATRGSYVCPISEIAGGTVVEVTVPAEK